MTLCRPAVGIGQATLRPNITTIALTYDQHETRDRIRGGMGLPRGADGADGADGANEFHGRGRLRRTTLTTLIREKRSCAERWQDDSFLAATAVSTLLPRVAKQPRLSHRQPHGRLPQTDKCSDSAQASGQGSPRYRSCS
jgi:hypothetical protein